MDCSFSLSVSNSFEVSSFNVDNEIRSTCPVADWFGYQVKCVSNFIDEVCNGLDDIFSDISQMQKVAKVANGIFLLMQVVADEFKDSIIVPIGYQLGKVVKWINAIQIFAGVDEMLKLARGEGPLAGKSDVKIASRIAIRVGNLFETFDWLAMVGVEALSSLNALFGKIDILGEIGDWSFSQLGKPFMLVGSVLTIIDIAGSKLANDMFDVKAWLGMIGECGKILLIVLAPTHVFTIGFAVLILVQNGAKLAQFLIDKYEARNRQNALNLPVESYESYESSALSSSAA